MSDTCTCPDAPERHIPANHVVSDLRPCPDCVMGGPHCAKCGHSLFNPYHRIACGNRAGAEVMHRLDKANGIPEVDDASDVPTYDDWRAANPNTAVKHDVVGQSDLPGVYEEDFSKGLRFTLPMPQTMAALAKREQKVTEHPEYVSTCGWPKEDCTCDRDGEKAKAAAVVAPREDVLREAIGLITGDRNNQYGPPTQDFQRTAGVLNALGYGRTDPEGYFVELLPSDVAIIITAVKFSRLMHSRSKRDNWTDAAGYMGCGYECTIEEN